MLFLYLNTLRISIHLSIMQEDCISRIYNLCLYLCNILYKHILSITSQQHSIKSLSLNRSTHSPHDKLISSLFSYSIAGDLPRQTTYEVIFTETLRLGRSSWISNRCILTPLVRSPLIACWYLSYGCFYAPLQPTTSSAGSCSRLLLMWVWWIARGL